jgi:hypothetical protein
LPEAKAWAYAHRMLDWLRKADTTPSLAVLSPRTDHDSWEWEGLSIGGLGKHVFLASDVPSTPGDGVMIVTCRGAAGGNAGMAGWTRLSLQHGFDLELI